MKVCIAACRGQEWKQWDYILHNMGVLPTDVWIRDRGKFNQVYEPGDLDGIPVVVMTPIEARYVKGEIALDNFEHPEDCVYWFGSDHVNVTEEQLEGLDVVARVYIPTPTVDQMYSWQAFAVTAWDRRLRG